MILCRFLEQRGKFICFQNCHDWAQYFVFTIELVCSSEPFLTKNMGAQSWKFLRQMDFPSYFSKSGLYRYYTYIPEILLLFFDKFH